MACARKSKASASWKRIIESANVLTGVPRETQKSCMDFFNQFGYWGRLEPEKGVYEQIECKAKALHEHIGDFAWLYGRLQDYRSRKTLYAILNNWYRYDFASTAQTREYLFDDYFDLDIVRCTPQEVLVDLGAYTGDTVLSYLKNYGEDCYRKIYCYEITPKSFETLQRNLAKYERVGTAAQRRQRCARDNVPAPQHGGCIGQRAG